MQAVQLHGFGGPEVLHIGEVPDLQPGVGELKVRVMATALNRADLLQRKGGYPPPPGASEILGLEMAGVVMEIGDGVEKWRLGERVCALLPGGGYAQEVILPAGMAMRLPDNLSFVQGAALPEVFLTAYLNAFELGGLHSGDTVLVHAGASGVGTAAIQLIREAGGTVLVTAGSAVKLERCRQLGAIAGWNYNEGSFVDWVKVQTEGRGVNMILDFIGAPYFNQNLHALAVDGRLIIIGTLGGSKVPEVDLGRLLFRRLQVIGTALRSRSVETKLDLVKKFSAFALPRFSDGRLQAVVDRVFDWRDVAEAHRYMEQNQNVGKIVLQISR